MGQASYWISPRRRAQTGHTLIEVMIASFVFTVGALGLARLMYSSHSGVTAAEKITQATALARSKLDELMTKPYTHADLAADEHTEANNLDSAGAVAGDYGAEDGSFARSWTVAESGDFKTIIMTVQWYDGSMHMSRQISLVGGKSRQ